MPICMCELGESRGILASKRTPKSRLNVSLFSPKHCER